MKNNDTINNEETFFLFTYGTLMRGEKNDHLLKSARFVGKFKTRPKYNLLLINGNFSFPALMENGDTSVLGEVYEVPLFAREGMDRLEGHPYNYCRQNIELDSEVENGKEVIAYLLVNKEWAKGQSLIKSGNWLTR